MLEHSLNDSASELVHTHIIDLAFEGFHNELNLITRYLLNYLLNDMITICILDTFENLRPYLLHEFILDRGGKCLKCLLNDPATVLVTGEPHDMSLQVNEELLSLV